MYFNKALIIGNITRDPELKALPSGAKVCSMSVATNRTWKDESGAKKEATDFHNIIVFGRQAETTAQYLKKGAEVMVEGRIQTRSWDDKDGKKQYRTEIVAERVQFGSKRDAPSGGARPAAAPQSHRGDMSQGGEDNNGMDTIDYPADDIAPEDIPF